MTDNDALINLCLNCKKRSTCGGFGCTPKHTIFKLIERNEPKKIKWWREKEDGYDMQVVYIECPKCEYSFTDDEIDRQIGYCPECGQSLDWSDDE